MSKKSKSDANGSACHKCPVSLKIAAGEYRTTPWKKTPCARCMSTRKANKNLDQFEGQRSHAGRTHVSFCPNVHECAAEESAGPDPESPFAVLSYAMKTVLSLDVTTREIVMERIANPGCPFREIAERLGIGLSTAHDRLHKARREWPALGEALQIRAYRRAKKTVGKPGRR